PGGRDPGATPGAALRPQQVRRVALHQRLPRPDRRVVRVHERPQASPRLRARRPALHDRRRADRGLLRRRLGDGRAHPRAAAHALRRRARLPGAPARADGPPRGDDRLAEGAQRLPGPPRVSGGPGVRAFVLAGGLGTRLRASFGDLPKVLVPVGGTPWIDRQLAWLAANAIRRVVVCVGHGADQVQRHVADGSRYGSAVAWWREETPLGTGGALARARGFVDGPALIMNGDTLPECDPWALERSRWEHGALAALALFQVDDARAQGRVERDAEGRVAHFVEKDERHRG